MYKIKQLSFVLFIFSALAFSYPVTQGFAQSGGQCDSNPACDPTSGTCCNQCDPNPACVASDPHAIPCCSQHISGGDVRDHRGPSNYLDRRRGAPEDVRDPRDYGDVRDPRDHKHVRGPRDHKDVRDPSDNEDVRDPRDHKDVRDPRDHEDVRDPRDHEDVRDPRDHGDTTFDDRPWREILKKCRQMKKSGRLSPEMRQECKAARKLKKESRR